MRDPNRIPVLLQELARIWQDNPDLRLGQILGNCDITYFTEDDVALEVLRKHP